MASDEEQQTVRPRHIAKSLSDIQRFKLEKLMENPDKPVPIPPRFKEKALPPPPEFNRNVMGSSAGAGSGEFHVYRHIRRREYARQKQINEKAVRLNLDEQYHQKIENNKRLMEEKTAKKRAKRIKKKQNQKIKKSKGNATEKLDEEKESEDESEDSSEDTATEDT